MRFPKLTRACILCHRTVTGLPIVLAEDLIEETANTGGFMAFSGVLRCDQSYLTAMPTNVVGTFA